MTIQVPSGYRMPVGSESISWIEPDMPTPYTGDLVFPSKYGDDDAPRDDVDPEAEARYAEATADIKAFEKGIVYLVYQYMKSGRADILECVMDWMFEWASVYALLSSETNSTGEATRKWVLSSIASAYLRLVHSESRPLDLVDPFVRSVIDNWLYDLAIEVTEYYDTRAVEDYNNHDWWAAWAVMATGVCLGHRPCIAWGLDKFSDFESQCSGGYLQNELDRGSRALQYHNFSIMPLVMIAAMCKANGYDRISSISSLANVIKRGIADPSTFEDITGYTQDMSFVTQSNLAWLDVYKTLLEPEPTVTRPLYCTRLGGPITTIYGS